PKGRPPLASNEEWLRVPCPRCGGEGRREADTMDTFVDSSWYFLRYCDPHNDQAPFARELVDFWMPVDQYVGGIDHATGHLLYSRFFVKVLNELGLLGFREPFARLFHQGWVRQGGTKMSKSRAKVTDDIGRRFVFNTPIAAVMELVNELGRDTSAPGARFAAETAVSLIQPYAPHVAEELWSALGHERLWEQPWPVADESKLAR